jgi:hypothetical protein
LLGCALFLASCQVNSDPGRAFARREPVITNALAPEPVVWGSRIQVIGANFDLLRDRPVLEVIPAGNQPAVRLDSVESEDGEHLFEVNRELVDSLGRGVSEVDLVGVGPDVRTPRFPFRLEIGDRINLRLTEVPRGAVHRNELGTLVGRGFLGPGEGTVEARFEGASCAPWPTITTPTRARDAAPSPLPESCSKAATGPSRPSSPTAIRSKGFARPSAPTGTAARAAR